MRQEDRNDKRLMRVGFCCQIVILEACFKGGDRSAMLEERFTLGASRFQRDLIQLVEIRMVINSTRWPLVIDYRP